MMAERGNTDLAPETDPVRLLHVFPTFGVGGVQVRMTEVINNLGGIFRHSILALDGDYACSGRLSDPAEVDLLPGLKRQAGLIGGLGSRRRVMRDLRPDLLLTYNWGAVEWAFSNTVGPICRHIHLESGFGSEEADRLFLRRTLFRRLALSRSWRVVVPSQTLVRIATQDWKIPSRKVVFIPNGVDCKRFAAALPPPAYGDGTRSLGPLTVGAVGPLRPEKNLAFLLDAIAALTSQFNLRLAIIGTGSEEPALRRRAQALGIADRVEFRGHVEGVEKELVSLDVFALTSKTEQLPNGILQAMAGGKMIVAVDVGDVKRMLSPDNRPFVTPKGQFEAFVANLEAALANRELRTRLGIRNRAYVQEHYPLERMVGAYRDLFLSSIRASKTRASDATSPRQANAGPFGRGDG